MSKYTFPALTYFEEGIVAQQLFYAVQIGNNIYVLHAFQKKSKSGIATPKPDIDLIKKRYKEAQEHEKHGRQQD